MRTEVFKALGSNAIARLRRIRGAQEAPNDKLREAVTRVFKTPDGQILLNHMLLHSYGMTAPKDAPDSALREIETRKKFLDQILALVEDPSATAQPQPPPDPPVS